MMGMALIIVTWCVMPGATNPQQRFDDAREMARSGQYLLAASLFETIDAPPALARQAVVEGAECLMAIGHVERAQALLDDHPADTGTWYRARAALETIRGDYPTAIELARQAVARDATFNRARYELGRLYELTGALDAARSTYEPFDKLLFDTLPVDPTQLHYAGLGFYRYSVIMRVPNLAERTQHVLQEVLQPACMILDLTYWPARLSIADLLRDKYSLEEALEDYRAVLDLNAHSVEAHLGIARIALQNWDFENTERRVQVCLDINPRSTEAYAILSALRMLERRFDDARLAAVAGLANNPSHLECLGLLASAYMRLGQSDEANIVLDRANAVSTRPARVHAIIGKQLSDARQFPDSEKHLLKSIEQNPSDPWPRNELAMMYMQWGREDAARDTADAAFELDQFNAQTKHTLDLLGVIEDFDTHVTEHFEIHYDGQQDSIIGHYMGDYLESIYDELTEDFEVDLTERTIIEVFPDHRQFGVRIHGKPWIHTIGACTGRVIAMDAPRHGVSGPYHYAHVLRHEFTHTVTLAATENRIPHWFTEGLAVLQEDRPRSWDWMVMLARRLQREALFPLSEIDWGFIRPRRSDDRQVAYAQKRMDVRVFDRTLRLRHHQRYARRLPCGTATQRRSPSHNEHDAGGVRHGVYFVGACNQAASWQLPLERPTDPVAAAVLTVLYPQSPRLLADRARIALEQDNAVLSEVLARRAVALDPMSAAGHRAAARAQLTLARHARSEAAQFEHLQAAREHYETLAENEPDAADAAEFLADWAQEHGNRDAAIHWATRAQYCSRPTQSDIAYWHGPRWTTTATTTRCHTSLNCHFRTNTTRTSHVRSPESTARSRSGCARSRMVPDSLWIDAYDADIHRAYAELLIQAGRPEVAVGQYRMLTILEPDEARGHADLAFALHAAGRRDEATQAVEWAVAIDPEPCAPAPRELASLEASARHGHNDLNTSMGAGSAERAIRAQCGEVRGRPV